MACPETGVLGLRASHFFLGGCKSGYFCHFVTFKLEVIAHQRFSEGGESDKPKNRLSLL
jgi:hypothetical protein